jgi:glycosyltransferase involved in cell wall biosynthesis
VRVSFLVPAYNEAATIVEILDRVSALDLDEQIVVVDDGSTDGTGDLVENWRNGRDNVVLVRQENRGKGAAVRAAIPHADGDICVIQDADLEYDPADYPLLLQPILDGKADVVLSSRFLAGQAHRVLYFWHSMGNRVLTLLSNVCTNLNLTDMESGYKLFTREVVERVTIQEDRFGFEPEIVAKVARLRCRVYEVGVSYAGRTYEDGKKVTWRDGVRALWCIVKYSWLSRG